MNARPRVQLSLGNLRAVPHCVLSRHNAFVYTRQKAIGRHFIYYVYVSGRFVL
jgi:hypothetical protein